MPSVNYIADPAGLTFGGYNTVAFTWDTNGTGTAKGPAYTSDPSAVILALQVILPPYFPININEENH
ncbi:MAG: hypothetical protein ABSD73_12345 [Candidatus Bathyarchaeia archaeon]|jgi:hypothetical protein